MLNLRNRVLAALGLTALADFLIYSYAAGCGVTLLALTLGGFVLFQFRDRLNKCWFWVLLWLTVALGASYDASIIGQFLLIILGWAIIAMCLLPQPCSLLTGITRGFVGGGRSFVAAPADARRYLLVVHNRMTFGLPAVWVIAIPIGLVLIFGCLIIPANLVLTQWSIKLIEQIQMGLQQFFEIPEQRIFFWIFFALGSYGLFRYRLGKRALRNERRLRAILIDERRDHNILRTCILSFAGLNLLFLLANGVDLAYLWMSFDLPEGMTYSEFAHQGSYRLMVAVVLAAVTVTAFMPTYSKAMSSRWVRLLSIMFILQNIMVLASGARRLYLYEEVYGMTQFRVATMLWMILVFIGFLLILVRVLQKRNLLFLFQTNTVTTILMLTFVSLANIDGFIADWNVNRYEQGSDQAVDVEYLQSLEAGVIPALVRLEKIAQQKQDSQIATAAKKAIQIKRAEETDIQKNWQSWTWRRKISLPGLE